VFDALAKNSWLMHRVPFRMLCSNCDNPSNVLSWLDGVWDVHSVIKDVQAPCGIALFGGNATFTKAKNEIGTSLDYSSRFIRSAATTNDDNNSNYKVIADREYNVKSIAKVALGENSVINVATATPNKFSCLLAPKGSPTLLTVDLIVLNRRQENPPIASSSSSTESGKPAAGVVVAPTTFDCAEVVREIVSPVDEKTGRPLSQQSPPILKEIETISMYRYNPDKDEVYCQQRSAAFLLPSNENPISMKMWQASQGRAIDVRFYDVTYKRRAS
jgi:hypothetical protein